MPTEDNNLVVLDLSKAEGNILLDSRIAKKVNLSPKGLASLPNRSAYLLLRELIGKFYNVSIDNVVLGNGSDELIEDVARIKSGGTSITLVPAFERLFEVNEKFGYKVHLTSLPAECGYMYTKKFHQVFVSEIEDARPNLIWLCSPDNPTGTIIEPAYIRDIATRFKESWVIIDVAFLDILNSSVATRKYIDLMREHANVILVSSFSKSWGLSALRIGFLLASSAIAQSVTRQNTMFNINGIAVDVAQECINNHIYRGAEFVRLHKHLDMIRKSLKSTTQYEILANSDINIFCLRHRLLTDLHGALLGLGIKTKSLDKMPGMKNGGFCRILVPREIRDVELLLNALLSL